jgi:ankyrin repeat protein
MMDIDENANGPSRVKKSNGKLNNQIMEDHGGRATPQFNTAEGHGPTPSSTWAADLTREFGHEFVPRGSDPDIVQTEVLEVLGDEADTSSDAYERNRGLHLIWLLQQRPSVILEMVAKWGLGGEGSENADDVLSQWAQKYEARVVTFANGTKLSNTLIMASRHGFHRVVRYLCTARHGIDSVNVIGNAGDNDAMTPLLWASQEGHLEVVKTLLGVAGVDVNKANSDGATPLHFASYHGHLEVVKTLVAAKADVDKADNGGETPLYWASQEGHVEVVETLVAAKADVDKADSDGATPLHFASYHGHLEVVKTLVAAKPEVDKADNKGKTPLKLASQEGHVEVVKALMGATEASGRANVTTRGKVRRMYFRRMYSPKPPKDITKTFRGNFPPYSPEVHAAQPVDLTAELAEVLRWREMDWSGIPPLSRKLVMPYLGAGDTINLDTVVTNKEDREHLVKAYVGLRSAGLDGYAHYRVGNDDGVCLGVQWAQKRSIDLRNFRLEYMDKELAKYLKSDFETSCDARDLQRCDTYGDTALHAAVRRQRVTVARALLRLGAEVSKRNNNLQTPLHYALGTGNINMVNALLEQGAGNDVRVVDIYGDSPLSLACKKRDLQTFRALVEAGGSVNSVDCRGRTALDEASSQGLTEGVRYLCGRGADVNKRDHRGRIHSTMP